MNSYAVARDLAAFARQHGFDYIQRTVSHWHIVVNKKIANVYYGRRGFSLYVDSSTPTGAFRTDNIEAIFAEILQFARLAASDTIVVQSPASQPVTTPVESPRRAMRLSASKKAGGFTCRVAITRPPADSNRSCATSVTLISEGNPLVAVHLHDGDTDETISVRDAASIVITVTGTEPTAKLIRLLRFAALTLEEMVERNAKVVEEANADPV